MVAAVGADQVQVTFLKSLGVASASDVANYAVDRNVKSIADALVGEAGPTVRLTISPLAEDVRYTLIVGVLDPTTRRGQRYRVFRGLIGDIRVLGSSHSGVGALDSEMIRAVQQERNRPQPGTPSEPQLIQQEWSSSHAVDTDAPCRGGPGSTRGNQSRRQ
jgi:hypothetical protein